MNPEYDDWGTNFESNGERIYFTGTNEQGKYVQYTGGPAYGGMMGGNLACVSCHGPDGRGGLHWMHMQQMDAPDIRFVTLSAEESGHQGNEKGDEHGEEYDIDAFRQAVILGQHPDGDALSRDMPRWQIDDEDLNDLFEFLKGLP